MDSFFDTAFWQSFISDASATFLGVLLGVPVALWIERWRARQATTDRRLQILKLLRDTLVKNHALLQQMVAEVKPDYVIFYNVDNTVLDSTASLKYELLDDVVLNRLLEHIRYELQHLHRKVELQLEIEYGSFLTTSHYRQMRSRLLEAITGHLQPLSTKIDEAVQLVDGHLRHARRPDAA